MAANQIGRQVAQATTRATRTSDQASWPDQLAHVATLFTGIPPREGWPSVEVLFARERFSAGVPWTDLGPLLPGWTIRSCSADELADRLGPADVLCPFGTPVDEGVIAAGQFGLLQQFGVGLDGIDLEAATEHGVWVARLPGELTGNADSVAELAVLFVLTLLRRFDDARQSLRERRWGQPMGRSVAECTVLIVGLGAVGRAVLARLRPFGSRIVAVRAHPERGGVDGVDWVRGVADLGAAVSQADVVVCCATLDAASQSLFGANVLGSCKPGSIFVNVARGGLVDEVALLNALDSGVLAGAGLDVHATEPADPDSPLLRHPKVIATPHVAGLTGRTFDRSGRLFAANLQRWAAGSSPDWAVNAPAHPRRRS